MRVRDALSGQRNGKPGGNGAGDDTVRTEWSFLNRKIKDTVSEYLYEQTRRRPDGPAGRHGALVARKGSAMPAKKPETRPTRALEVGGRDGSRSAPARRKAGPRHQRRDGQPA